jgi:glycosyltransferase involved in cell wall biosynthesis
MTKKLVSIVIPAFNEVENVDFIHSELIRSLPKLYNYEFLFVDDGSTDSTSEKVHKLHEKHLNVRLIRFSRNFGKELATTAGIETAKGDAIITIDADGQHPTELIQDFLGLWENGNKVVVGVRKTNSDEGLIKKYGSSLFYRLFNLLARVDLIPGSTDFRLIDKEVQEVFCKLKETNRITRGLIDWMGYRRDYVYFHAKPRIHGEAGYSTKKLFELAANSFVTLSFVPLYLFGYIGLFITAISFALGIFVLIEEYVMADPLKLNITGAASLGILLSFLTGTILISQWLTSQYISRIYQETKRRPLFIIDKSESIL